MESNQLLSLPIGVPSPSNFYRKKWMEMGEGVGGDFMGSTLENQRGRKGLGREQSHAGAGHSCTWATITSNAPQRKCPGPFRC